MDKFQRNKSASEEHSHRQRPVTLSNLYSHRGQNLKYQSGRMIAAAELGGMRKEAMRLILKWLIAPPVKMASLWFKDQNTDFSK
jgi:hypothetical protein